MKHFDTVTFTLDNYEGPIDFLLHLVQKNEIDIYEVPLSYLTQQFMEKLSLIEQQLDVGAEFLGTASSILLYKSRTLLPKHEQIQSHEELEYDPRFEIIHQLIDYCKFKEAARGLAQRELQQSAYYSRASEVVPDIKKNLGIDHLSLSDLAGLFQQVLQKAVPQKGTVKEEIWKVSDKITYIRKLFISANQLEFPNLFNFEMSREELIVTFLAVLELMKLGELRVLRETSLNSVIFYHEART